MADCSAVQTVVLRVEQLVELMDYSMAESKVEPSEPLKVASMDYY